jgi:hypothetical protein
VSYDRTVVARADEVVEQLIAEVLTLEGRGVVVGEAPAGAGKSYAVVTAVQKARKKGLRVAVATPTNEQAYSLIDTMAARCPREIISFIPARDRELPGEIGERRRNVRQIAARESASANLIVGTLSKLGDAHARGALAPFDLLIIDEAFQANSVHYYGVGALADRHLLMGDRGQLAPFSTAPEGLRWRGLDEDPLLTAVEVVQRTHPEATRVFKLPITRRLDPRGATIAQAFYPGHAFRAAVRENVRRLQLKQPAKPGAVDKVIDHAATHGWAHVELPGTAVTLADPGTIERIVDTVRRVLERGATRVCEQQTTPTKLLPSEIAVAVSHNDQKNLLRAAMDDAGLGEVEVNTANKLQGLTFQLVIAWHPLAGLTDVDEFHLDPGRLCVMLTRHRHACIVFGRASDRELVEGIPPASPAFTGWDGNPTLEGWYAHEVVFNRLAPHRFTL